MTMTTAGPSTSGGPRTPTSSSPAASHSDWSPVSARWIRGYAVFWVAGLGFLWWPVLAIRAGLLRRGTVRPDAFPIAVSCLLGLSLVGAALSGAELTRLAGAGYNLIVWVAIAAVTRFHLHVSAICRGIAQLAGLQSVAILAALAVYPALSGLSLPAAHALPRAVTQDPALESFTTVRLVTQDYFGESVLRSAGFFGNATWGGALSALGILATIGLLRRPSSRAAARGYGLLMVLDGVALYLSYSRNTWIALGLSLAAMGAVALRRRRAWSALTLLGAGALASATWAVTSLNTTALVDDFNSVREGSYDSRASIYAVTWKAVLDLPFPLLGNGIKDRVPGLVASMGTHSTYLGVLYRGGWMVACLLVLWLLVLAVRSVRLQSTLGIGAVVFVTVWLIAEDVDAGHLAPLALVLALAATRAGDGPTDSEPHTTLVDTTRTGSPGGGNR